MLTDIPPGVAAVLGALTGVLGTCAAARWAYLAATTAAARKDRLAQIQMGLADVLSLLQILAFSCRHSQKPPEEEIELYEKARSGQNRLLILLDPSLSGTDQLIDAMEAAFGVLTKTPPPSKEDIASSSAAILAHGHTVIKAEQALLRKGK